ncbi:MAG: hypothetical protein SFV19_11110 [Rhodospirillaceae bacterium]|nr:hypothetical protein [Rhodospirillaceae bacterium]
MLLLSLSLNLMLLAIFVVLNATADVDQKRVKAVLTSVQQSFGDESDLTTAAVQVRRPDRGVQDVLRSSISEAFKSVLQGDTVVVRREADRLWVSAPATALFESDGRTLRAALPVLDRVVALLNAPPDGVRYDLLLVLPEPGDGDGAARAGLLAQDILRRGLRPELLNIGTMSSADDLVTFTFIVSSDGAPARASGEGLAP